MTVGIGLPIGDPDLLLTWARRADAGPFSTLGLLDRLVYDNPEPLVALSVLAGATSRVRLQTEVLLAPLGPGETLPVEIRPGRRFDAGAGPGRLVKGTAEGGVVGVLIDCRGRPLQLPRSEEARMAKLREWEKAVG